MKARITRRIVRRASLALVLVAPAWVSACRDDEADKAAGGGGGSRGGDSNGGASGNADEGGEGGLPSSGSGGDAGDGNDSGRGGTSRGGSSSGQGGSEPMGGNAGESTGSRCDLGGDFSTRDKPRVALPADIAADMTLDNSNDYTIREIVRVNPGATLTIPPCTRIEMVGPSMGLLVVQRGARIVAEGTPDEPILFTSLVRLGDRFAGQSRGVMLLGRAPVTRLDGARESTPQGLPDPAYAYGAEDPDPEDDSGILRYVRIEFTGYIERTPEGQLIRSNNGLTLAGVGSGTTIDHVMVSGTLGDCFEWSGGTVRANHLVANNCGDDYFDVNEGFQGGGSHWFGRRANFAIATPDPNGIELRTSRLEEKLDENVPDDVLPRTNISLSNLTLCGTGQDSYSVEQSFGIVVRELSKATLSEVSLAGFDFAIDTRSAYHEGDVAVRDATLWDFVFALDDNANETGMRNDDVGFVDGSVLADEASNEIDPGMRPFPVPACVEVGGPAPEIFDSSAGAFADGAEWMEGAWIDWAEE